MKTHLDQEHQCAGPDISAHFTIALEDFLEEKRTPSRPHNELVNCSICGMETNWKMIHHMRVFHDDKLGHFLPFAGSLWHKDR